MYNARIERIRQRMDKDGLDALLVTSLANVYYLSGFTGSTGMLLIGAHTARFISDFRYHEQYKQQVDSVYELFDNTGQQLGRDVIPRLAGDLGLKTIGFEAEHVNCAQCEKLPAGGGMEMKPTTGWVEELRAVKDDQELERLTAAIRLNEEIFGEVVKLVGPGVTENDLAAEIEYRALKKGSSGTSFRPIVASGPNSAKPHAGFSMNKLVEATPLTFDMGVKLNGYCSDMTRTVFFRDCPKHWEEVYNVVREAKDSSARSLRPGLKGKDVDAVARDVITEAGHGEHFGHGLGHGIGVEVHENPRLATTGEIELVAGHVVTVEPGIYLPGEGGIRIEDICVVTETGAQNMNELDTELMVVG